MVINAPESDRYLRKTRSAYTWTRLLGTPFWALYILLTFIMRKDLGASPFEIACVISVNPIVSIFSFYWSAQIQRHPERLVSNIIWSGILGHLPFLFVPFIKSPWFFVFASGIYMFFYRGVKPAWMEVLKVNIPEDSLKVVYAYTSGLYHVGGALLAIFIGWLMDDYVEAWRWLFPIATILALSAALFQINLPVRQVSQKEKNREPQLFKEKIQRPWINAWQLLKRRPDFTHFQIGFMLGGGGLMLWQPALPNFFLDVLHLNFKELAIAITLCKSVGYTMALPMWTVAINRINLFRFSAIVTIITALFPLGLMAAQSNILWLYAAYLIYGVMQAGSELSWNLSAPIFSKYEDSSTYTGVNILAIGLRGCLTLPLGTFLCGATSSSITLLVGSGFCFLGTWQMYRNRKSEREGGFEAIEGT